MKIETLEKSNCPLCNSLGKKKYFGLRDRLFGAPGEWALSICSDQSCAGYWLSPQPTEKDLYKAYLNYYTHEPPDQSSQSKLREIYEKACLAYYAKYFKYPIPTTKISKFLGSLLKYIPRRAAHLDFLGCHLDYTPNGKLLEIGCGNGITLQNMKKLGWDVKGVDVDASAVKICVEKGLPVKVASITDLQRSNEKFDAIVMSHVIEHLTDTPEAMSICYKLLKNRGKLVIVTPNIESLSHKIFSRHWMHLDPPRHLILFSMRSLKKLATKAGLKSVVKTSIRYSDGSFVTSLNILFFGRASMNSYSKLIGYFGKLWQLLHFFVSKIANKYGEEIILIGTKEAHIEIKDN